MAVRQLKGNWRIGVFSCCVCFLPILALMNLSFAPSQIKQTVKFLSSNFLKSKSLSDLVSSPAFAYAGAK